MLNAVVYPWLTHYIQFYKDVWESRDLGSSFALKATRTKTMNDVIETLKNELHSSEAVMKREMFLLYNSVSQ